MIKIKKRENGHLIQVELEQLKKLVPLLVEQEDLLEQLEAKSIEDFETQINKLTNFTNATVSANAFGKEAEYKRLLELETLINGKLSSKDLMKSKELKSSVIASVIDRNTEYYTPAELTAKKTLQDLMQTYNSLSLENRKHIAFNRSNELAFNIYSELRF
jgi:lipid-binding SYLF domain-containing protein